MLIVLVAALVGIVIMSARARNAGRLLSADLESERHAHGETRRGSEHLETRMRTLRAELAEAHHTNADLTARITRTNPADAGRALG